MDFTDFIFHKVVWRRGEGVGMFSNDFITNFPQNAPVKKCLELVSIWQRYGQKFVAYFLGHPVHPCVARRQFWENFLPSRYYKILYEENSVADT